MMTNHTILWRRLDEPGHDFCQLTSRGASWLLAGTAIFMHEQQPCRLDYEVICDSAWHTRSGRVTGQIGDAPVALEITVDSAQRWQLNGAAIPAVEGCIDFDLNFSPSTNLLSIRRMGLAIGAEAEVRAAWLHFPNFILEPLAQTYRRIGDATYFYTSLRFEYIADLQVDALGFVTDYPGLWRRER
jgi:uncharacterized protein